MGSMDELRSPSLPTSPAAPVIAFPSPSMLSVLQLLGTIRCPKKPRAAQRRPFYELAQSGPAPIAAEALLRMAALYRIESEIRGRSAAGRQGVARGACGPGRRRAGPSSGARPTAGGGLRPLAPREAVPGEPEEPSGGGDPLRPFPVDWL